MAFDLLLTGADVIDVGGGHVGRFDVGVRGGRIAAIAPALPATGTREVIDATGRLVTPGLVDLHTHVHPRATFWGVDPDPVAWYSGVTTWVDAGSAGAYSIAGLRAATRAVRVHALLNISAVGLIAPTGECRDLDACDVALAVATVSANRDLVAGVKVRIDHATVGANGLEPLRRALAVGRECDVPVMVHIGTAPPEVADVLALLRPGDIVTHCASAIAPGLVTDGKPHPAIGDAYAAGVRFDIGHGIAGFAFETLDAFLAAGLPPHTVSTDLHTRCLYGPVFDLPTTMAKLLAAGLALPDVVAAATVRPAEALGLPGGVGTLAVGAPADLAVFRAVEPDGGFEVVDARGVTRRAPLRLVNEVTYLAGRPLPPRLPAPPPPWIPLTAAQRVALERRFRTIRELLGTPLVDAAGLAGPPIQEVRQCPSG